jgi:hypothetical protein
VPFQADYVLRLIEQLNGLISAMKERLSGAGGPSSEEPAGLAAQAISLVLGMDPAVASRLSPQTLVTMIRLGDVHPEILPLLAEAIELEAQALEAAGRAAEAGTRRAQADAVRSVT